MHSTASSVAMASACWAEGILYVGRGMALLGERDLAIAALRRCVDRGFVVFPGLFEADPWFDAVQGDDAFEDLLREGEARRLQAETAFRDAGGDRLLGIDPNLRQAASPRHEFLS